MLLKLDRFFVKKLMQKDGNLIRSYGTADQLYVTCFGIVVGWAWVDVVTSECHSSATPSCPSDVSLLSVLWFLLMVIFWFVMMSLAFHWFNERWRLMTRVALVSSIQQGSLERFFGSMDADNDGDVSREELTNHVKINGLRPELFDDVFCEVIH